MILWVPPISKPRRSECFLACFHCQRGPGTAFKKTGCARRNFCEKAKSGDWLQALGQLPLRFQGSTGIMIYQDHSLFLVVDVLGHS